MGKPEPVYTYDAKQDDRGRWIGTVLEDEGLSVPAVSRKRALKEIKRLHREVLEDERKWLGKDR